jgi:hypothetical protein
MNDLDESPLAKLDRLQSEAEARGFERGVREAANEVRPKGPRPCDCKRCDCGNMGDLVELTQYETMQYASVAILALLEPKLSELPHNQGISD